MKAEPAGEDLEARLVARSYLFLEGRIERLGVRQEAALRGPGEGIGDGCIRKRGEPVRRRGADIETLHLEQPGVEPGLSVEIPGNVGLAVGRPRRQSQPLRGKSANLELAHPRRRSDSLGARFEDVGGEAGASEEKKPGRGVVRAQLRAQPQREGLRGSSRSR